MLVFEGGGKRTASQMQETLTLLLKAAAAIGVARARCDRRSSLLTMQLSGLLRLLPLITLLSGSGCRFLR